MTDRRRPLSPHLQVYRLPLTGLLSITHRMTGVVLSFALIAILYVLATIALGEPSFLILQQQLSNSVGKIIYSIMVFAMVFHLCHGTRHLLWDSGRSFDRHRLMQFAVFEILAVLILTGVWLLISF